MKVTFSPSEVREIIQRHCDSTLAKPFPGTFDVKAEYGYIPPIAAEFEREEEKADTADDGKNTALPLATREEIAAALVTESVQAEGAA